MGPLGPLLDAEMTAWAIGRMLAFETENLLQLDDKAVIPGLLYLFRRIEQRLDGSPTLILLDEAWSYLQHELFRDRLKDWLKTMRRKNAVVVMATQQISDIANSQIADVVLENCPTKILLPNAESKNPGSREFYTRVGLNERELEILQVSIPKQHYYVVSTLGRRLVNLGVGKVALSWVGVNGREERQIVESVMDQFPDSWRAEWLRLKGLPQWAEYYHRLKSGRGPRREEEFYAQERNHFGPAGVLSVQNPQPVEAGAFATEVTQLLNHAQLVMQYIRQGEAACQRTEHVCRHARNVKNLPSRFSARSLRTSMLSLRSFRAARRWHIRSAIWISSSVRRTPATATMPAPTTRITATGRKRRWTRRWAHCARPGCRVSNFRASSRFSIHSRDGAEPDGRMQALHALGDISEQQVEQLMKLREIMLADMSSKQAYQAAVIQQQAARKRQRNASSTGAREPQMG